MATIFGNSMATGNFAKDSSSALGTEDGEHEDGEQDGAAVPNTPDDNGASSSATRPNKRAKTTENDDIDELVGAFDRGSERLATAIEKMSATIELPADLILKVQELAGFNDTHKAYYYSHLVENPRVAKAFYDVPFEYKLTFMSKWVSENFLS